MEEIRALPTLEDLSKAIDCLTSGKAPGNDGIPPEVLKSGKPSLLQPLQDLLCHCWDMRDANIVTLYKNKGDRSDCNNYPGHLPPQYSGQSVRPTFSKASAEPRLPHLS